MRRYNLCSQLSQTLQGLAISLFLLRAHSFQRGMAQEGVNAELHKACNTER